MAKRDFETDFWNIVTHMAARDPIVGILATSAMGDSTKLRFIDLPDNAKNYMYVHYGLNADRTDEAFSLAQAMPRPIAGQKPPRSDSSTGSG